MNSVMSQQITVVRMLVVILGIAFLVGVLLVLGSIVGAHAAHSGIMLIAPAYQMV